MRPWMRAAAAAVTGAVIGTTVLLVALAVPGPQSPPVAPACPTSYGSTVEINGTPYWCTTALLNWNNTFPGVKLNVTFHDLLFQLSWNFTFECSEVHVTGHEPSGVSWTLFVVSYCTPYIVKGGPPEYPGPNFFSPDRDFGATWVSNSNIQLYAQAPAV